MTYPPSNQAWRPSQPAGTGGDQFNAEEHKGRLVLVYPKSFDPERQTSKPKPTAMCEADIIIVAVQEAIPSAKVKKGEVARAVVVRTTREYQRADGTYIKFDSNSAVLISKENEPLGTRICGTSAISGRIPACPVSASFTPR